MNDIDISKRIREIRFSIASPDMIRAMGTTQITIPELYENNCPKFSGLFDLRMGTQDNLFLCKTCKNNMKDCSGHFGYIDLARKVYFIHFLPTVKKILQCVCYKCSNLLIDKTNINIIKKLKKKSPNIRMKIIYKLCSSQSKKTCTNYNGCGRLQPRYIKEGTNLFVVHKIANPDGNGKPIDKKVQLNADDCYDILRKISDEDCELLGCSPIFSRPEWLICSVLPVPPPCVRPSVKHDANLRSEDDLTYKLLDIIKANNSLMVKVKSNDQNHINDYIDYLQYNITTLIDNEVKGIPPAQQRTGRLLKSIRQRLKGKEGRIRGNIMGKRVNFSARSVISPDPNIDIDELGVPLKIAMNMTFPEVVNVYNIHALTTLVENGPEKHPGAKYIIKKNKDRLDLRYVKNSNITLEYGDVVERHMVNGDIVLFNRQPSLHKMSMMGHRVRVMPYSTFRLNVAVTTPYNADFDGDEMNLYLAQSVMASTEIEELVCVPNQIISPQSNKPVIGCIMDTVVGANNITRKSTKLNFKEIMSMLPHISTFNGNLPPFKVNTFDNKHIPDNIYLEGREIFSLLLPSEVNYFKSMDDEDNIEIINGDLITGKCSKAVTGTSGGSLVHIIQNDLGRNSTKRFLTEIQGVTGTWLMKNGFSVGIGDCLPDTKTKDYINSTISKAKANVKNIISATISSRLKLETGMSIREEFEARILNILNTARDDAGGLATKKLGDDNAIKNMVTSGSKGNFINISQIMASVGQQNVSSGAKSGRIPCGYRDRTLPHFQKFDDGPESKGFVENSFLSGLTPYEFFFHAMSGREGLIDTAVKSVSWDTKLIILDNGKVKNIKIGEWIDSDLANNKEKVIHYDEKDANMELLNLDKDVFIPTTTNNGNMSWEKVTKITRHDPSEYIYKVTTKSGRDVKVVESKSLLIWDKELKRYEEKDMKDIKIGDKVPVSINLKNNLNEIKFINMKEYLPKEEYIYGTDFNKAKNMVEKILENRKKMPALWWNKNNGKEFILPYKNSQNFLRTLKHSNIKNIKDGNIYCYQGVRTISLIEDKMELNEENGFFIGLYIAEGNSHIKSGQVCIANNDNKILEKIRKWFDKRNIINKTYIKKNSKSVSTTIQGYSTILSKFLNKFVGKNSRYKFIPAEFQLAPDNFIKGFIDGYYSGDGTISKNSIDCSSASKDVIEGVSMLLTRFGIYSKMSVSILKRNNFNTENIASINRLSIRSLFAKKFANTFKLTIDYKNERLIKILESKTLLKYENTYKVINDTILDEIISIEKILSNNQKVYDLTIPSTKNFGLYNGLQVYDTSETGYIQRRLMKAMEDLKVHYDMTVRNERDQIIQFIYGDDGFDATRIEKQKIEILKYNNKIFFNKYKWKKKELKQNMDKKSYKRMKTNSNFEEIIDKEFSRIENYRNYLRKIRHEDISYSPVHIYRIIKQAKNRFNIDNQSVSDINPIDIITKVEEICSKLRALISDDDIIKEINHKSMKNFKMLLRTKLSSKMVIMEHKLNLLAFDWIISKIYEQFDKSLVQPGEMVGSITAQSIGEPATQMTLNTFHLSGVASKSKITRGVPRLRELINVSKNPKTPSITVYLDKKISKNKDEVKKIINQLQYTNLRYFVVETSIHYDPEIYKKSTNITKDKEFVEEYYDIFDDDVSFENLSPWVLRIEFDHQYMLDKQFTMFQIYEHLLTKYDSKKIQVIFTDDCAKTLVLHIRFMYQNISKEITDLDQKKLRDFEQIVVNDSAVKGLKNIDKAFMREIKTADYKKNGDQYNIKEWIIETNGTNLATCLCNPFIDSTRTISNDIHEVKEIFGIEASRTILFEEIKQVIGDSGIYINDRHLNILVDVMTNKGYIMSIDRHGINRSETGPLARSSFEETTDQLVKAGIYSQVDNMVSVTANIMTGQKAKFGTHMSSIIQDMKLITEKGKKPVEIPREKKTIFSLKQIIS